MAAVHLRIVTGLGLVLLPALAEAQIVPRSETLRGQTVATRPRADFDPLGVRLDGFRVNAAAELGIGYDDNLFGTRNNRESDWFSTLGADLGVQSDLARHAVGVVGRIENRRYLDNSGLDWTDYAIGAFGRYDVNADTAFELRLNRVQEHDDVTSIDVQASGLRQPVQYAYNEVVAAATTRFNRFGLRLGVGWRDYSYENIDAGPPPVPGAPAPGDLSRNDYSTLLTSLAGSYELAPGRSLVLITRYQEIYYDETAQQARDSRTWEVLGGIVYDFDGVWAVRAAAGYRQRDFEGAGLKNLSGPAFEGEIIWQPTLLTTLTLAARRTIEESVRPGSVSFTRSQGQLRVDHEYLRNVILGAELGVDRRDYENPDEQATDGFAILSARWLINRNLALVGSYQHVRRLSVSSGLGLDEFDRNLFQLRLRIAL